MPAPSAFTFDLPPELVAQEPAPTRDASRLLHLRGDGTCGDHAFADVVELLPRGAVLVVNDTRVIPARVLGHKPTGGRVELLFLEPARDAASPAGTTAWRCLARARRPLQPGQHVAIDDTDVVLELLTPREGEAGSVVIAVPGDTLALLDRVGHIPLPRYVQREDRASDRERYQTMFARVPGAVAAPTTGLHMTPAIASALAARDVTIAPLTLHVGYGTFEPVRTADIADHRMHREHYAIPEPTAQLVASGRPVVALGTTALRALEAAALARAGSGGAASGGPESEGISAHATTGTTDLFVYPGSSHTWRVVDHLVTNFHLPESTLLMLVCAFAGTERVLAAYRHAVAQRYRFFSYGDAMLCHRAPGEGAP